MLGQNAEDENQTKHFLNTECPGDNHIDQATVDMVHPMGPNHLRPLVTMKRSKAVTLAMLDNIYRILEFARVSVQMFSTNFGPEQYNYTLPAPSGEWRSEEELALIDKLVCLES